MSPNSLHKKLIAAGIGPEPGAAAGRRRSLQFGE
jgi:hypothetical protein